MSVDSLLNSTCTIQTNDATVDAYGHTENSYSDSQTLVPCRLAQLSAKERMETDNAVVASHKLFLQHSITIANDDKITSIVGPDGVTLASAAEVETINQNPGTRQSHKEAWLKEVRE